NDLPVRARAGAAPRDHPPQPEQHRPRRRALPRLRPGEPCPAELVAALPRRRRRAPRGDRRAAAGGERPPDHRERERDLVRPPRHPPAPGGGGRGAGWNAGGDPPRRQARGGARRARGSGGGDRTARRLAAAAEGRGAALGEARGGGAAVKLLVASGNRKKLAELQALAKGLPVEVVSPADFDTPLPEVVEDGATFAENARKKALAFAAAFGLPAIADDSGLCVDALGGEPGVRSARWSGEEPAPDRDERNNRKLLGA